MDLTPFDWPAARATYIHVPFCRHRCGYCNFSLIANRDDLFERYLSAIDRELAYLDRPRVDTLFIGGGTPTHLDRLSLDRLLSMIRDRFVFDSSIEWTIEANPEDIDQEKLDLLVQHGVNRVSLGVQSFNNTKLDILQRGHDGDSARKIIISVAEQIPNVSIDLIFAAPGESVKSWSDDLDAVLELPIQHLSTYALTFEKGTSFWSRRLHGKLSGVEESAEVEMYSLARKRTAAAGLDQYEISSFARDGFRCRHNLAYWNGLGWYAAGPGAARFVDGKREVNHRSTTHYLRRIESGASPTAESETITISQLARERAAFGVRMIEGIDIDAIRKTTGVSLGELCASGIRKSLDEGLILKVDNRISLTERGILFADTVAARFLS